MPHLQNLPGSRSRPTAALWIGILVASIAVGSLALSGGAESPEPGDWPEFHGVSRENRSAETGLLARWPEGGPPLLWTSSECGAGYATVSVAEGKLFTSGDFERVEMVVALDLRGRLLWKSPNGKAWRGATPGARVTPTYRDGTLVHLNPAGRVAAFRASNGEVLWAVDLEEKFDVAHGPWALSENLIVDGDRVLCAPGGSRGRVVALDRLSGKTLWANTEIEDPAAYCSPIVVTHKGRRQLITLLRRSVVSVDVESGKLLWSHEHRTPYDLNVTSPVFRDGRVFVTSGYGAGGHLLEIAPDSRSVREVWSGGDLDGCHGGVLLLGDHLFGSGCRQSEKGFVCVDFLTGKTRWTDAEVGKVSVTHADGRIYGLGHVGTMMLLEVDPKGCRVVGRFQLPSDDRYDCLAHPVVCDGTLYVRQAQKLYAYDIRASREEIQRP